MRATATIAVLTVGRGVVNFALQVALAARFGASREADAYFVVVGLILLLSELLITLLTFAALPVLIQRWQTSVGGRDAWSFELALLLSCSLVALVVGVVLISAASVISGVLAPGFSAEALSLSANLLRVSAAGFTLYTIALVLGVALQAQQRFATTALVPVLPVGCALLALAVLPRDWAMYAPIAGFNLGSLVAVAVQLFCWRRLPGTRPLRTSLRTEEFRDVVRRVLPMAVATTCGVALPLMLRMWASSVGEGAVAAVGFASQVIAIPTALLVTPVATVLLARFAALRTQSPGAAVRVLDEGLSVVLLGSALFAGVIAALAEPIVRLAFERGSFTAADVATTTEALRFLAIGLVAAAGSQILGRALCAEGSVRSYALVWAGSVGVFALAGALAGHHGGIAGLTAIYSAVLFMLVTSMAVALRRSFPEVARGWMASSALRVSGTGLVAAIVTGGAYRALLAGEGAVPSGVRLIGAIAVSAIAGACAFAILTRLMNGQEARILADLLRRGRRPHLGPGGADS